MAKKVNAVTLAEMIRKGPDAMLRQLEQGAAAEKGISMGQENTRQNVQKIIGQAISERKQEAVQTPQLPEVTLPSVQEIRGSGYLTGGSGTQKPEPYGAMPQQQARMTQEQKDSWKREREAAMGRKAMKEYWANQAGAAEDRRIRDADLQEIESWSEEDRTLLESYVREKNERDDPFTVSNPFRFLLQNKKVADRYTPLVEKFGEERLEELAETYGIYLTEQDAETLTEQTAQAVDSVGGAIGHNVLGVGARLVGGPYAAMGRMKEAFERTGRYSTLAAYTPQDMLSLYGNTVVSETAQNIGGDEYDENGQLVKEGGTLRQIGSIAYQGGIGFVDSVARAMVGGKGGALILAAANSFSQTVSEASKLGATPEQAYALGLGTAAIEAATEKIPLDEMFKAAKGGAKGAIPILKEALRQAGIEVATEEASYLGNLLWEAAVLREKSTYKQKIGELVANGASYEEAKAQADKDVLNEALQTAAVSGFSGLFSGGGSATVGALRTDSTPEVTAPVQQEVGAEATPEAPVVEPAQQTGPSMEQLLDGVQDMTPAPAPLTEEQQHFDNAAAIANGMEPVQQAQDASAKEQFAMDADLDEDSRYHVLMPKKVSITEDTESAKAPEEITKILSEPGKAKSKVENTIKALATRLGITNKKLSAPAVDVEFTFSKNNGLKESISRQLKYGGSYGDFAKAIANIEGILQNAVMIEKHTDKYRGTVREDRNLESTSVLLGVFRDGNSIIPVQFEIKKSSQNGGQLYVTVAMTKIEADVVGRAVDKNQAPFLVPASEYSLTEVVSKINPADKHFLKYIPNAMLTEPQITAKMSALDEDYRRISSYERTDGKTADEVRGMLSKYGYTTQSTQQADTDSGAQMAASKDSGESTEGGQPQTVTKKGSRQDGGYSFEHLYRANAAIAEFRQTDEYKAMSRDQRVQAIKEIMDYYTKIVDESALGISEESDAVNTGEGGQPQTVTEQNPGIKGTGAAEGNFSGKAAYNATLSEDNSQADRRDDVRPMELPERDINGGNVSAVTGDVYGSRVTPDEFASLMEEPTARGDFSYAKITNDQATQRATETIASAGTWENAYDIWKQSVSSGNAGAEMSARGALFLNHAAQQGNKQLWLETLHYMQKLGTNTAQGLQAFRIIRTLNASDKIAFLRMSVDKMAADIKGKYGVDLEIDDSLIEAYENAETDEARDAALKNVQKTIADQIPSTFLDKWTALRYMNMLGNLKTNVRNIAGNVGSAAVYRVKDAIGASMEAIASTVTDGKTERTKSLFVDRDLLKACKGDFQQFKETVSGGGKYGERMTSADSFEQGVLDQKTVFKSNAKNQTVKAIGDTVMKPLEWYRRGTNWMMNNERFGDEAFGRAAYARALAGYLQANGVTGSDLSEVDGALLDKARAYAIKEAQEATFHDNSALARIVTKGRDAFGVVGEGIMPFTKTPANVLTRAEEFSPLGLVNSTVKGLQKAASETKLTKGTGLVGKWARAGGDISGADIVNSWAKTLTGTALFALGAAMLDQGLLSGGPDEDEEQAAFDELNGKQNYALQLPDEIKVFDYKIDLPDGISYTIDWLTPAAMPMFMGAQFWKLLTEKDGSITFADMERVFTSIADPMIQMSMLQGLNDSLDNIKYSDNNLGQLFMNAAVNYLTQGLTNTLMGQIERSTEENRQTTYVDKNSDVPQWLQRQLGKASQKIPGWDYQQMDYQNAYGQTEENEGGLLYNMLSPGYISKEQQNALTEELNRLREVTGENVFPQTAEKTVNYTDKNGVKHIDHNLSQEELETMQKVQGQTAAKVIADMIGSRDYAALSDEQKAAAIKTAYSYAKQTAEIAAVDNHLGYSESWMKGIKGGEAGAIIIKTAVSSLDKAADGLKGDWGHGWEDGASADALKWAYETFSQLGKVTRANVENSLDGMAADYVEARGEGISHDDFMKAAKNAATIKGTGYNGYVKDADRYRAIAETSGLSESTVDTIIKAYMADYNPNDREPDTTELKYDYIRQELDLSAEEFARTRQAWNSDSKKQENIDAMVAVGVSENIAELLYRVYKGQVDVVEWSKGK